MNSEILSSEVQQYISYHINDDVAKIALSKSRFKNVNSKELAEQIDSKKRCGKKLPLWYQTLGIYYPPKISIEQASSQLTAEYKSNLISGNKVLDLTGGFGVDSYFFSRKADTVVHCELNSELSDIAKHNSSCLQTNNIEFFNGNGIQFLKETAQNFDTIFIDPSRRIEAQKVFFLKDCEPNVMEHLDLLLAKSLRVIIKTSPLLDIHSGLRELRNVAEIHILSVKNDCKELLWIIDSKPPIETVVKCALLTEGIRFEFKLDDEKKVEIKNFSAPLTYLYEPDVSLLKSGAFKTIAESYNLSKLALNTHLYTSDVLNKAFAGRIFKVTAVNAYNSLANKVIQKQANVVSKNFPLSVDELRKKYKIKDGGSNYQFFTSATASNKLIVISAERIN